MTVARAITRAWTDDAYKAKLLSDPRAALNEVGVAVSDKITPRVVEDTAEIRHFVLPKPPPQAGDQDLDQLMEGLWMPTGPGGGNCTAYTLHCGGCDTKPGGCR